MDELRRERELAAAPDAASGKALARRGDGDAERRHRERVDGTPPPWVPTIFVRRPRG